MPGITDVLIPLAALGVGAYTVKKIVSTPQITPIAPQNLTPLTGGTVPIIQIGSNGYTPGAPISSSLLQFPNANLQTWASAPQMPEYMTVSDNGRSFIRQQEGYRNTPYQDVAGHWTVGIGHKITTDDGISTGQVLSDAQIQALFDDDVATAESEVKQLVSVPLTQGQFDALVDFVFNLGRAHLATSSLLRYLNAGNYAAAVHQFSRWVYADGKVNSGLVARRQSEQQMFVG